MRFATIVLPLLISYSQVHSQKEPTHIDSKIEKVTVFLNGAQVERNSRQQLVAGKYSLVFDGISPKIDRQSIQLKAEGTLTVLSVTHQLNFLKEQMVQEQIQQLDIQKETLANKMTAERDMQNVYKQEESMILKNQSIKGDNSTLKAVDLKEAIDFQTQRLTEIYQKLQVVGSDLTKEDKELQKLDNQLTALNQKKDLSTSEVIVAVDVKEPTLCTFNLTYLVRQSSWFPTYDVRVQDIDKPITLQMKANITQQSGEDWKDVKLFLSTGNPDDNGTRPTLLPWNLRFYFPGNAGNNIFPSSTQGQEFEKSLSTSVFGSVIDDKGLPVAGASITLKGTKIGTTSDAGGHFVLATPVGPTTVVISAVGFVSNEAVISAGNSRIVLSPSETALNEVVVTGFSTDSDAGYSFGSSSSYRQRKDKTDISTSTTYQPTTTVFEIKDPYSVPNDGKVYTVSINSFDLNAAYEYYAAPRVDESAYLTAKIVDWQDLNLLPGYANLFFEGTFLGNSLLDLASAGDTLKLSLGKDKGVAVHRTLNKEYSQKKFLGSNKTDSRDYEIVVRNNKQQPVSIVIEDQLPISTNKEIEIEKIELGGGKIDDTTKIVQWIASVDPKREAKFNIGYTVKYPRDKIVQLQ